MPKLFCQFFGGTTHAQVLRACSISKGFVSRISTLPPSGLRVKPFLRPLKKNSVCFLLHLNLRWFLSPSLISGECIPKLKVQAEASGPCLSCCWLFDGSPWLLQGRMPKCCDKVTVNECTSDFRRFNVFVCGRVIVGAGATTTSAEKWPPRRGRSTKSTCPRMRPWTTSRW